MAKQASRRGWGRVRKLPSGKWQAGYNGPDEQIHYAPLTFQAKIDAETWLGQERRLIEQEAWTPPSVRAAKVEAKPLTVGDYATAWLASRDLKPRTRALYSGLLEVHIRPSLGSKPLAEVTPSIVRAWHSDLLPKAPTRRAHAYSLLRTVMNAAVREELIDSSPCRIQGAGSSKRVHRIEPATDAELAAIIEGMPPRYSVAVLLAAWCSLRFGELIELRRGDIDTTRGLLKIRRGVVQLKGEHIVGSPKSAAGVREVHIPPHVVEAVKQHLHDFTGPGRDALVFTGETGSYVSHSVLRRRFKAACATAGRADLRWHDLRHTGATKAAQSGATLPELMNRLGHSTVQAALRYQHVARDRDAEIAKAMSDRAMER